MFTAANDVIFYTYCSVICESPYSTSLKPILVMATALPQDPSQHWRVATMSSIVPILTVNDGVLCATDKDDYIHSSCSTVMQLVPGDVVNLKASAGDAVLFIGDSGRSIGFSGFLYLPL